ncbi:MAG: YraN family protein [Christensenellaceae bacterium]
MYNQRIGKIGEDYVSTYLQERDYEIVYRNYRAKKGEIDIIAKQNSGYIFVEVKTRTNQKYGSAAEAVTPKKQALLRDTAQLFLIDKNLSDVDMRFDIAEVYLKNNKLEIHYIKNAF